MMMKTFRDECDLNFSDDVDDIWHVYDENYAGDVGDVDEVGDVYDVCAI